MTTTETKHTPGPWKVAGHGNGKQELPIYGPSGEIACIRGEAHLADARLIAAAPVLLQALRDINSLLAEYAHAGAGRPVNPNHYRGANGLCPGEIARAAIAKATGQN